MLSWVHEAVVISCKYSHSSPVNHTDYKYSYKTPTSEKRYRHIDFEIQVGKSVDEESAFNDTAPATSPICQ